MANHNANGGRAAAPPAQDPPNWRPQDPGLPPARRRDPDPDDERAERDDRAWRDRGGAEERDARRWESDEDHEPAIRGRAGWPQGWPGGGRDGWPDSGRDGWRADSRENGRYGEERLRELQRPPRRDGGSPSAGSFEERERAPDAAYRADRARVESERGIERYDSRASYRGRDFEPERRGLSHGSAERIDYPVTSPGRGDERLGYAAGSYRRGGEGTGEHAAALTGATAHVHRGTGPHRGKGPAGYQPSDEAIRERVCESLTEDDQIDATHIDVSVSQGEVTLAGTVDDRRAKRDAEDCAYSVPGVRDVQNLLRLGDAHGASPRNPSRNSSRNPSSNPSSNPSGAAPVRIEETQTSAPDRKHRA